MTRKKAPEVPEEPKVDPFIGVLQKAIEDMLELALEPKDRNVLIGNGIKFLMVKHKITGRDEEGSFFDD